MLDGLIALVLMGSLVAVPLWFRVVRDRRKDEALKLQARLQSTANQRLGGESYLVVTVEPGLTGHRGRVVLSAPERWRGLVDEVWKDVRAATPAGYDLVVPGETDTRSSAPRPITVQRPA
jgi:hypothetical protein